MIIVVDIEEVPTRYSGQWKKWIPALFDKHDMPYYWIGFDDVVETENDEFLSFASSNDYKARQTQKLASGIKNGWLNNGDIILFLDAWHPGIPAVRQMLMNVEEDVKIAGFWHAGSWDPHDMLGKMSKHFIYFEKGIYDCLDMNMFATEASLNLFMLSMETRNIPVQSSKSTIAGFPYDTSHLRSAGTNKENLIVFPHRIAIEKQPYMFDELAERLPQYKFVKTIEVTKSKDEYHDLLARAKYAISFARQETFGISMMESTFSGCMPIVPDCLSYHEMYAPTNRYNPMQKSRETIYQSIIQKIRMFDEDHQLATHTLSKNCDNLKKYITGEGWVECLLSM